jgi:hypothetical protein
MTAARGYDPTALLRSGVPRAIYTFAIEFFSRLAMSFSVRARTGIRSLDGRSHIPDDIRL